MRHASHPLRSFNKLQRIADAAGPQCSYFTAGSAAGPGADARARRRHAATLAVRRGPRAPWGTGRGSRNSMKISARRDSDHTRRRAGLARPPDLSTAPMPAPSRRYGDGLPVVFQRLSVATGLTARGAAFARPGGGPDAVWRSPDLAIGDRPRGSVDARRPRRGRF